MTLPKLSIILIGMFHLLCLLTAGPAMAAHILVHDPVSGKALGVAGDGEVLVKLRPGVDRVRLHARAGGIEGDSLLAKGWVRVKLKPGVTVEDALRRYGGDPAVETVQPDFVYRAAGVAPNDPLFASQSGLAKISASAAWDIETGATRKVTVAVLDTGIDRTHPDLVSKLDTTNWRVFCPGAACLGACTSCSGAA